VRMVSVVLVLVALAVAIRGASDIRHAVRGLDLLNDDAYYYTVVARNFATTGEMTFDGISRTNGYHPLWFWLQVGMFKAGAAGLSTAGQALAVILLQWGILGAAFAAFLSWVHRHWIEAPAVATASLLGLTLLAYPKHLSPFTIGMESVLVLLFLPVFLLLVWRSRWVLAGLVALLLVMSRLDTLVYVVFPTTLYAAFRKRPCFAAVIGRGLAVGGPALAGVAVLMAVYHATFGHAVPIHGVLKSSFPAINFQPHLFTQPIIFARALGSPVKLAMFHLPTTLIILPVCGLVLFKAGVLRPSERRGALLLALLGLIQLASFLLFQKWAKPLSNWYLAPLIIFTSGAVGAAIVNILGTRRTVLLCLVLALGVAGLSGAREYRRWRVPVPKSTVHAFVRSREPGTLWAATDCGTITFWTGAPFINLDGLINGFEYQAALKKHDLGGYLERAGTDFLVVGAWGGAPPIHPIEPMYLHRVDPALYSGEYDTFDFFVYSYMYDCYSDTLTLSREQEVWRSGPETDGIIFTRTVIFDLTR
jgi:hypothetical protein